MTELREMENTPGSWFLLEACCSADDRAVVPPLQTWAARTAVPFQHWRNRWVVGIDQADTPGSSEAVTLES
jgi:hypothetical protein